MIRLSRIVKEILNESMTFNDLFRSSTIDRKKRTHGMRIERLAAVSGEDDKSWNFSYRSSPHNNTTGKSWEGKIVFLKETGKRGDDIPCKVDCSCPDFRYKFAYVDHQQGAAPLGSNSLSGCINKPPTQTNPSDRPGMCKHLLSLKNDIHKRLLKSKKPTSREKLSEIASTFGDVDIEVID